MTLVSVWLSPLSSWSKSAQLTEPSKLLQQSVSWQLTPSPTDFKPQSGRPASVGSSDLEPSGVPEVGTLQFHLVSIPSKTLRHASFPKIHPEQPVESWLHRPSMKFSSAGTQAKTLTRGGAWASASVTWHWDPDVFAGKKWNCSYSVILTGRGSPLFHGSRLCRCPAGNRLQTRWWRSLHRHSSLHKKRKKKQREKKENFIFLLLGYYGNSLHCGVHLFPWFFCSPVRLPFSLSRRFFSTLSGRV